MYWFLVVLVVFVVVFCFFCMIWSYIIIFSPPEHRKHHLNLKWGDLIFWFRPTSCTHFATFQHMKTTRKGGQIISRGIFLPLFYLLWVVIATWGWQRAQATKRSAEAALAHWSRRSPAEAVVSRVSTVEQVLQEIYKFKSKLYSSSSSSIQSIHRWAQHTS